MTVKLMQIPNDDSQNYSFYSVKLVVETLNLLNQPIKIPKSPKMLGQRIKKVNIKLVIVNCNLKKRQFCVSSLGMYINISATVLSL